MADQTSVRWQQCVRNNLKLAENGELNYKGLPIIGYTLI